MPTQVYNELLRVYSHQGWWPINNEYKKRSTLSDTEKFEIIVGALLTQNTSWIQVEKALNELRKNNCLSVQGIIETKQETLGQYIKPAGYFNQKSERLKIIAQFLLQHPLAELQQMETNRLRALLLSVKGIGPETADSIILYAFSKPSFVIDTYTKRIMSRIGLCRKDVTYDELQELIVRNIPVDVEMYNEYHALLVEHAKQHCQTKPICADCPLSKDCKKLI
ncbi:endonuclease [Candidatus Woesearchaeota archaeon]|nr:endonuclease [Candidatus Woesearchaeota archaeon]